MKYYFKFYNIENKEKYYIHDSDKSSICNTNLDIFNLKIFTSDINIDYSKITSYKLVLEKEVGGLYSQDSIFYGTKDDECIRFEKCILNKDSVTDNNVKYNCYLEFNEGGIIVYTSVKKPVNILFKNVCEDFEVSINNSIYIGDSYELQDEEVEKISFEVKVDIEKNNTLQYYYTFNSNDKVECKDFSIFGSNIKEFEYIVATNIFKDNSTKLHFFLKDLFGNIRYKIYKINTKNESTQIFDIIDYNKNIIDGNTELNFFYNSKNVSSIKPKLILEYKSDSKEEIESNKEIGLLNNNKNIVSFVINEYFPNIYEKIKKTSKISLVFIFDNSETQSKSLELIYDNTIPNISFNNINNDYLLINEDKNNITLTGQIQDSSFFYIGKNKRKYNFEGILFHSIVYSEKDIFFIKDNGKYKKIQNKFGNYYLIDSESYNFTFHDDKYEEIDGINNIVNDNCSESEKIFYIYLDCSKLSTYEMNLIENNDLIIKENITNKIKKQEKFLIENIILFKLYVSNDEEGVLDIDIGIDGFDYNFIKYINKANVSCEIDFKKRILLNFDKTQLLFVNFNDEYNIVISNNSKIIDLKNPITIDNLSIVPISLKNEYFFTSDKEIVFTDNNLNLKESYDIYYKPTLKINDIPEELNSIKIDSIQDGIYNFELNIPVKNFYNKYEFLFKDTFDNENEKTIHIEKQIEKIKISFDEKYSGDIVFKNDGEITNLYINKNELTFKLLIENETKQDKENNDYIIFNDNKNTKYKISREQEIPYVMVNLYNLKDEQIYYVTYSDSNIPILTFKIFSVNELFINCNKNNISGMEIYYLYFETNEFSKIKFNSDNSNFRISDVSKDDKNRILQIQRLVTNSFIESVNVNVTVYDEKNIFTSKSEMINVIFYNDNVTHDYWIDEEFYDSNRHISAPSFDLKIKTLHSEYIKSIYYYDELELDFYKRKKNASKVDDDVYVIKNIVTPITPSSLKIVIDVDYIQEMQINKTFFENDLIQLSDNLYDFTVDYTQDNDKIVAKIKNNLSNPEELDLEINANGLNIYKQDSVFFNNGKEVSISINNNNLNGKVIFDTKLKDRKNQILKLESCELIINNNYKDIINEITNLKKYNIKNLNDNIEIRFKNNSSNYNYLKIIDPLLNINEQLVATDSFNFKAENIGLYQVQHILKYIGKTIIVDSFYIYVSNNYSDDIFIKNSSFEKYNFIKEIIINNISSFDLDILEPKIIYYKDGEKIKEYSPYKFENGEMKFIVDKHNGDSEYIYEDNFISKIIYKTKIHDINNIESKLYDITTKNNKAFYTYLNAITLEGNTNLYFKSIGISEILIKPKGSEKSFRKIILEKVEDVILSGFIPCKLECFDNSGKMIKEYNINIEEDYIE